MRQAESRCAKNQRNGPCGGSHQGICEARERECIPAPGLIQEPMAGWVAKSPNHAQVAVPRHENCGNDVSTVMAGIDPVIPVARVRIDIAGLGRGEGDTSGGFRWLTSNITR